MPLIQSWRWYGPNDIVSLTDIEAGRRYRHRLRPITFLWGRCGERNRKRKRMIEWNETDSRYATPVGSGGKRQHPRNESIKMACPNGMLIDNYCETIRNLAARGID